MTNNDKVPDLTKNEFDSYTKKGLVLVDFFAEWCMPCVMMTPVMDELSEKMKGKVKFAKINIDENGELAKKFSVVSIPNFVLFKNGDVVDQFVGALSLEEFEEKLKAHL
ncbi:MAG TPA: thioredoxin [Candidatus Pacearchaeota archaeon]|nr:thioredoxin [Candidatus Pacearchaeota archaeon]